jgi:diguanylate cyclase (GGDEF)-like protein/PAS domain S-box-containing protein
MLGVLFVAAFASTVFPPAFFPGGWVLLGSIAYLLIIRYYGAAWGLLAALVCGICTIALWQHPFVAILFLVEAAVVGMLLRRGMLNLFLADGIYWIFFGLPLTWLIHSILLGGDTPTVLHLMALRGGVGMANALVATLLARFLPIHRWHNSPPTLLQSQFNLMVGCFLLPAVVVVLFNLIGPRDIIRPGLERDLEGKSVFLTDELSTLLNDVESILKELAQAASRQGFEASDTLGQKVAAARKAESGLLMVRILDSRGHTVAHSVSPGIPETAARAQVDRFAGLLQKAGGQALVTGINADKNLPVPHISWYFPVLSARGLAGMVQADLDARVFQRILADHFRVGPYYFTILDRQGKTLASSDPEISPLSDFFQDAGYPGGRAVTNAFLWQPQDGKLVEFSFWSRIFRGSTAGGGTFPWTVAIKVPGLLGRNYLQKMVAQTLLVMLLPALGAIFFGNAISRRLSNPIRALGEITANLPEKLQSGESVDWPVGTGLEADSLVRNFKAMMEALKKSQAENRKIREVSEKSQDETLAQHKWEVFTTSRSLRVEREQRRRIEELLGQLEIAEAKFRFLVEKSMVGVFILRGVHFYYVNPRFAEIFGYDPDEFLENCKLTDLVYKADRGMVYQTLRKQLLGEVKNVQYQFRGIRKNKRIIHLEILKGKGTFNGQPAIIGTLLDITERKQAEETILHMAYHDHLTDLPNRILFRDRVELALSLAKRNGQMAALLFIDLDRFKAINDSLGHAVGDSILQEVAARLKGCVREVDTISRFGGDEFNLLLTQIHNQDGVAMVANKILKALQWPFHVDQHELFLTCSIGVAMYPQDGTDVHTLIRNADTALYRAKDVGRNNFQVFAPSMNSQALERMELENSLRRVFEREELRVYYQAQVDLVTGAIIGVEALLRWQQANGEMVSPAVFIPLAEEIGLIFPIGEWVLRAACHQAKLWQEEGLPPLRVGVNVSAHQFQDREFLEGLLQILDELRFDPKWLNLEITESVLMRDVGENFAKLRQIQNVGITVAIDDFGVGYSSLSYLKDYPVDQLKMDCSFVRNLPDCENDVNIARHIVEMAHSLGMKVIAEGVEKEEQLAFLKELGCDEVQGFLLGAPLPAEELFPILVSQKNHIVSSPGPLFSNTIP